MSMLSHRTRPLGRAVLFFLLPALLATPGAAARADADEDDDGPVAVGPQPPLYLVNEALINRAVFGTVAPEKARAKLDSVLELKIQSIERTCGISPAQKARLQLAGRGDIKRLFDRIDDRKNVVNTQIDQGEYMKLMQELRPFQLMWLGDPFGDGSYFSKALRTTLDEGQVERFRDVEDRARRVRLAATIDHVIVSLDASLGLSATQRGRLASLLLEEVRPPLVSSAYNSQVVLYQMANLPEARLRPLFDDSQWLTLQSRLRQARNLKPLLIRSGYLAEDGVEVPARRPDEASFQFQGLRAPGGRQ